MKHSSLHSKIATPATFIIIWGLILEFPVRYLVSPDPWVHDASHWYFAQPLRLLLELGFVLLALLPFFLVNDLKRLLRIAWTPTNRQFLALGILGSVLFFGLQQWEDITVIQQEQLMQFVPLWFVTGLAIGISQELTFRGLIYTGLSKRYGIKWAAALSTLLFVLGAIHSARLYHYVVNDYIFESLLLLGIFILAGLFFVWVRIKTDNILIPALIHGIGNAITWATFVVIKLHA